MAIQYAPLFALETQFQTKDGRNNTGGWLKVFLAATDDPATTYSDYNGTRNPEKIILDDDGRALVICDKSKAYRLEVYDINGMLLWTEEPVYCSGTGGGGVSITRVISTNGSISIDESVAGSTTTYDLSAHVDDSTDLLGWIRCDGASNIDGTDIWKPTYTAGTLMVGERGIMLTGGQYFHATAHVRVTKTGVAPYYDDMGIVFATYDGETRAEVSGKGIVVDGSMGLSQDFEVSCDVLPESDCELLLEIAGKELASIGVQVLDMEVHRVFSGAPYIPGGVAGKSWVEENYQEKLTPGTGIEIDENNVISTTAQPQVQADWAQSDSTAVDYIKNKPAIPTKTSDLANDSGFITGADLPTVDQTYDDSSTNAQSGTAVAEAIAASLETFIAVYGVTTIGEVDTAYAHGKDILCRYNSHGHVYSSQLSSLVSGVYTFSTTDGFTDYEFTLSPNGGTGNWSIGSRAIPSGAQLVPEATQSDAGEVLTVNQNGVPEWAPAQALISAGNGIDITNNVVSAKVDGTSVTFNANGELEATAAPQVQSDWAQSDSSAVDYIKNKPLNLVQDANYVHTDNNFTNADKSKLDGIQSGAEVNVQANWNEVDSGSDSYIQNKPQNLVQDADYVHTDNNFTNTDKTKLDGVQAGAEVNVQSDWAQTDSSSDDFIKNKPQNLVQDADYVHTDNNFTTSEKTKLAGVQSGAEVNVQANWNETDSTSDSFIQNKPANLVQDANYVHTDNNFTTSEKTKLAGIQAGAEQNVQSDWLQTDTAADDYIKNKPEIPVIPTLKELVAGTGVTIVEGASEVTISAAAGVVIDANYVHTDNNFTTTLKNKLNGIATGAEVNVQADWNVTSTSSDAYIKNKPSIPSKTSDLTNDSGFITASQVPAQVNADWNASSGAAQILNKPNITEITWTHDNQGASVVTEADSLDVNQDTHRVQMSAGSTTVELGFTVPTMPSAPQEDMFLTMASGNTVPTWSVAPEGHTVGFEDIVITTIP